MPTGATKARLHAEPRCRHRAGRGHASPATASTGATATSELHAAVPPGAARTPTPTAANTLHDHGDAPPTKTARSRWARSGMTVNNVAPSIASAAPPSVNEGRLHADARRGHRAGHGHAHRLQHQLGRRRQRDLHRGSPAHAKAHTYADGANAVHDHRPLTTTTGRSRNPARSDHREQRAAPTLTGTPTSTKARPTRSTLGAVTDPGGRRVTAYSINWGDGGTRPSAAVRPARQTHTYADGPNATRSSRSRPTRTAPSPRHQGDVTVNNVAPTLTAAVTGHRRRRHDPMRSLSVRSTEPGTDTATGVQHQLGRRHDQHFTAVEQTQAASSTPTPTGRHGAHGDGQREGRRRHLLAGHQGAYREQRGADGRSNRGQYGERRTAPTR